MSVSDVIFMFMYQESRKRKKCLLSSFLSHLFFQVPLFSANFLHNRTFLGDFMKRAMSFGRNSNDNFQLLSQNITRHTLGL